MIKLDFSDERGKIRFEFVFEGFVLGGGIVGTKGLTVLRRELVILDLLESISEPFPCGRKLPNGDIKRSLTNPTSIEISGQDFDLIYNYVTAVPWSTGSPLRNALEVIDWLVEAQRESKSE